MPRDRRFTPIPIVIDVDDFLLYHNREQSLLRAEGLIDTAERVGIVFARFGANGVRVIPTSSSGLNISFPVPDFWDVPNIGEFRRDLRDMLRIIYEANVGYREGVRVRRASRILLERFDAIAAEMMRVVDTEDDHARRENVIAIGNQMYFPPE